MRIVNYLHHTTKLFYILLRASQTCDNALESCGYMTRVMLCCFAKFFYQDFLRRQLVSPTNFKLVSVTCFQILAFVVHGISLQRTSVSSKLRVIVHDLVRRRRKCRASCSSRFPLRIFREPQRTNNKANKQTNFVLQTHHWTNRCFFLRTPIYTSLISNWWLPSAFVMCNPFPDLVERRVEAGITYPRGLYQTAVCCP